MQTCRNPRCVQRVGALPRIGSHVHQAAQEVRMTSLPLSYRHQNDAIPKISGRRHELDWLRVLIIVGLIPFHVVGLLAVTPDAYLVGAQTDPISATLVSFFGLWPMSLLFLVAGASAWFA